MLIFWHYGCINTKKDTIMRQFILILMLCFSSVGAKQTTAGRIADIGQIANPVIGLALTVMKEDEPGMFQWLYSTVTNAVLTAAIKGATNKIHGGRDPMNKRPNGKPHNFPSGHTSAASVGANFIALRYGFTYAIVPYVILGLTAAGRVQVHKHTEAGVIAGAMVGLLSAFIFTKTYVEKKQTLTIAPVASKDFRGLHVLWRF